MPNHVPLETARIPQSNDPNQTDGPFIQTRFQELRGLNHVKRPTDEQSQPTSVTNAYSPVPYRDKVTDHENPSGRFIKTIPGTIFSWFFNAIRGTIQIKGYCFKEGKEGEERDEFLHSSFLSHSHLSLSAWKSRPHTYIHS
jgi:hypothetical protein